MRHLPREAPCPQRINTKLSTLSTRSAQGTTALLCSGNDDLEQDAGENAQKLAQRNGDLEHDTIPQEKGQAECLAMHYDNFKPENFYAEAVRSWHGKRRDTANNETGPGEEDMYFDDPEIKYHFGDWDHFGECVDNLQMSETDAMGTAILVSKQADNVGMSFAVAEEESPSFPAGGKQIYVVARVHAAFGVANPRDVYERVEHHERC